MLSSLKWWYKPEERQHCKVGTAEMLLPPCWCKPHWNVSLELSSVSRSCSPALDAQAGSEQQRLRCRFGPTSALQLSLCSLSSGLEPGTGSVSVPGLRAGAPWAASASSLPWLCLGMSPVLGWALAQPPLVFPGCPNSHSCSTFTALISLLLLGSVCQYLHQILACLLLWNSQWARGDNWNASNFYNKLMGGSYK